MSDPISPLSDVFSSEPEVEKASSAEEKPSKADEKGEKASQKFPASSQEGEDKAKPAADKKEKKAKPADKEKVPVKAKEQEEDDEKELVAESEDESEEKEEKPSQEEKKEAPKDKWDTDENPYKKRFSDTAANWHKEHQEKLQMQSALSQLQQEMTVMRKIADGTYDPEKDAPKMPTPETIAERALEAGKVSASYQAAVEHLGEEKVAADVAEFNRLFEQNPVVNKLVLDAKSPIHEALRILDRYKFEAKYGSTPAAWHKSIRAEVEAELRETITQEVTEKLLGRADKKESTPRGLPSRGSNGLRSGQNSSGKGHTSLKDILG